MKLEWTVEVPQPAKTIYCRIRVQNSGLGITSDPTAEDLPHILRLIPPEVMRAEGWVKSDDAERLSATTLGLADMIGGARARLTTIIDEAFGLQPVPEDKSLEALFTTLERLLYEERANAEKKRQKLETALRKESEKVIDLNFVVFPELIVTRKVHTPPLEQGD